MKQLMMNTMQYGCIASSCAAMLCLVGCKTSVSDGVEVGNVHDQEGCFFRVETPKGFPGALEEKYLVIDVSGGQAAGRWPVTYLDKTPAEGWSDNYKTDKIVLRKVNAGSYLRQRCSPEEAWNGKSKNPPLETFVEKPFYIGVFEITQRQFEHVTGMNPSLHSPAKGWEKLPVENVTYDDIRGQRNGACYPNTRDVDAQSFMGILRQKTGLNDLDLPTENEWEYCCSAGGSFIEGTRLEPNARFSRYPTVKEAHTTPAIVGTYKPNVFGLYDMQGNVHEWCLDAVGKSKPGEIAFRGFGCDRIVKGGHYDALPQLCHPSIAYGQCSSIGNSSIGFRICCH